MTLFQLPSARAEECIYRVNRALADFRSTVAADEYSDPALRLAYDAVRRLVTTAEIFASEHLVESTDLRLPDHDLVQVIWDERTRRVIRDWGTRRGGWK